MYNPQSLRADEFIDHSEVLDTLNYAAEHARDAALIDAIIAKAAQKKRPDSPRGLSFACLRAARKSGAGV